MTTTETSTGPTEGGARLQARGRRRARNCDPGGRRNACRGCSAGVRIPGHLRHVGDIPRTACRACPGTSPVTVPETVSTFGAVTVLDGRNATAVATRELQILPSTHGDQSGVIGSAAMILDHVLSAEAMDALI